jgi:esterase/lipase superfamily enzyme
MHREYHKWFSWRLNRDMELLVFGHAGERVLVFPTRLGRFYEYEDGGMVHVLHRRLDEGSLQLFCVDSIDAESLYCFWRSPAERIARHWQYEEYILNEVLPFTRQQNPHSPLTAHGCSLGAFHAVNIAMRHPHQFSRLLALSGRYDLTEAREEFGDLFSGHYDDNIYFNTPSHFLPNLQDPEILAALRRIDITLAVGDADPFLENNRALSHTLWNQGIWHAFHVWSGRAHSFRHWRQMVTAYW